LLSKIDRVELYEYDFEVKDVTAKLHYMPGLRSRVKNFGLRIFTDDGLVGEYCPQHAGKSGFLGQILMVAPMLIGRDPMQRVAIWDDLKRSLRHWGGVGVSHIDIALWDLAGKRYGAPVAELLGGYRARLPAYASTMHGDRHGGLSTTRDYADFALHCLALGYTGFKIHGWNEGDAREEAANVAGVAEAVNGRMKLMLDPASELRTFADALYVGQACDANRYFWYEDPMRDGGVSIQLHRRLKSMLKTPLLITEHVRGVEPKADWMVAGATDFVRIDPDYDMGITGVMRIAHAAEALGYDVEMHQCGPAQRHCMAALRNTHFYEIVGVHPRLPNPIPPVIATEGYADQLESIASDGTVAVPTEPGLGVTFDWNFIAGNQLQLHVFE
jgi:L-alanine-DL-glutamate epimerase-like enolase superfamily enzyme